MSTFTLVRRQLADCTVWVDRDTVDPHDGVVRAYQSAACPPAEIAAAVLICLTDPSPAVRKEALATLDTVAPSLTATQILPALEALPEHFLPLAHALATVALPADTFAIPILRRAAFLPLAAPSFIPALARLDPEWLLENIRQLLPATATFPSPWFWSRLPLPIATALQRRLAE
ncbi:MAG: hypothetical protein NTV52_21140 [Acidobacteria bacterium]|nr:hypothetical protein [Acidobacteriota bacterium]